MTDLDISVGWVWQKWHHFLEVVENLEQPHQAAIQKLFSSALQKAG